jgi:DNA-binding NtrC family response regulator
VLADLKQIHPGMCAIMLTGYPTEESARKAKTLGACAYCVKPIENAELEEKVAAALTKTALDG